MELRIDFPKLPEKKSLLDMRSELDDILGEDGWLVGSGQAGDSGYVELELEDEKQNPKYGIMAVKAYLQRAGFDPYTTIELAGTKTRIFD